MRKLLERLKDGEILVGDGAMGTMLFARGLKPGECPESLNLTDATVLTEIAAAYLEAGADIVQTNTFGGSPLKLAAYRLDSKCEEINSAAVAAVKTTVAGKAYVSGSCGPSGRILKPYGDTEPDDLHASFRRQIAALAGAGVDILCIETMTDLREATIAVAAAREVAPELPVMATMTFDATPKGFFTVMGTTIEAAAAGLCEAGADIIGSNCGNGIDNMVAIAAEFRRRTKAALIIQSNAGLPELRDGQPVYTETPEFMAARVPALIATGVSIIGGCCGTTPDHIRAIKAAVAAGN